MFNYEKFEDRDPVPTTEDDSEFNGRDPTGTSNDESEFNGQNEQTSTLPSVKIDEEPELGVNDLNSSDVNNEIMVLLNAVNLSNATSASASLTSFVNGLSTALASTNEDVAVITDETNKQNILNYYSSVPDVGEIDTTAPLMVGIRRTDANGNNFVSLKIDLSNDTITNNNTTVRTPDSINLLLPVEPGSSITFNNDLKIMRGGGSTNGLPNQISVDNGNTWLNHNQTFTFNGLRMIYVASASPILIKIENVKNNIMTFLVKYSYIISFFGAIFFTIQSIFNVDLLSTFLSKNFRIVFNILITFFGFLSFTVWMGGNYNNYGQYIIK